MTSVTFRGATVLTPSDNIDDLLIPGGAITSDLINSSFVLPDGTVDRVSAGLLYLVDSSKVKPLDTEDIYFFKVYPYKYYDVDFDKLAYAIPFVASYPIVWPLPANVALNRVIINLRYRVSLMQSIIAFYEAAIEETEAKQIEYDKTYYINPSWGEVYLAVSGIYNTGHFFTEPISFIDAYNTLISRANIFLDFYQHRLDVWENAIATNTAVPFPEQRVIPSSFDNEIFAYTRLSSFFQKPRSNVHYRYKTFKLGTGSESIALTGFLEAYSHKNPGLKYVYASTQTEYPYKTPYNKLHGIGFPKTRDLILVGNPNQASSLTVAVFTYLSSPELFLQDYAAQYSSYYYICSSVTNGLIKELWIPFITPNGLAEYGYEPYPDMIGNYDYPTLFISVGSEQKTKTRRIFSDNLDYGFADTNTLNTHSQLGLIKNINTQLLRPVSTNLDLVRTLPTISARPRLSIGINSGLPGGAYDSIGKQTRVASNLLNTRTIMNYEYQARYQDRTNFTEARRCLVEPAPLDLTNVGSNTNNFSVRFLWELDPENIKACYIRSRKHIYAAPSNYDVDGFEITFLPPGDAGVTPYVNWIGGSTQPPSALKMTAVFDNGLTAVVYCHIKLEISRGLPLILTNNTSSVEEPDTYNLKTLNAGVFEAGLYRQATSLFTMPGKSIIYVRLTDASSNPIIVNHYLWDTTDDIYFHIYTTEHHFSEPE
jgi:hypothetical protein